MPSSPPPPSTSRHPSHGLCRASRRLSGLCSMVVVALGLLFAGAASPALADTCANAAQRVENSSTELPDCRAYEMVTPPYKEGFTVDEGAFTDDGLASYTSTGNFADNNQSSLTNAYLAARSSTGWVTTALSPPSATYDSLFGGATQASSADLHQSLWVLRGRDDPLTTSYYLRSRDGVFTPIGPASGTLVAGTSTDLSHVIFNHGTADTALYEYVGTGNGGPPRSVSVDNTGGSTPGDTCPNSTSADGRVIAFTSGCRGTGTPQVWARVGGSATVSVSGSECTRTSMDPAEVCNGLQPSEYAGASVDGSRVFFTTAQQLVNGDTDSTTDLYACDIPAGAPAPVGSANRCSTLTQVSGTSQAKVESVTAVSDDGSRVYFVAQGVLADNLGVSDAAAVAGHDNLYLWTRDAAHPAGNTKFITEFGAASGADQAQMTPDGRYLLLATSSALVTSGPGADGDGVDDLYRYDADTNAIVRVSTATSGTGGNGLTSNALTARTSGMTPDGSIIVFTTAEALSSGDTDGVTDVYAWHEGQVSMISRGGGSSPWVTSSGRDIFFATDQPLTAADGDVNGDIYDARVEGGFDLTHAAPCSGVECRGQPSSAPSLASPSALAADDQGAAEVSPAFSLRAVSAVQRRRLATTGKLTLTVTANTAGLVSVKGSATIAGKTSTVASARRNLTGPGAVVVTITLSKRALSQLAERRKLAVKIVISHSKVAIDRSVTLKLVRTKAKKAATRSLRTGPAVADAGGGRS
jgi:hypothetical protein